MAQDTNGSFVVRFVATDRGVKAETRVNGKIAFPSNRGKQPQAGETWRVSIAGTNPKETVYFLKCIETVADSFAPVPDADVATVASPKSVNNQPRGDRKGNRQKRKGDCKGGERRDGDRKDSRDRSTNDAPRVWSFGPSSETAPVGDYIFVPGGDAYEQAKAWLTPVTAINLANLKFATAQRAAGVDSDAVAIACKMRAVIVAVDETREHAAALAAELKGMSQNTRDVAGESVAAKKRFEAATAAKQQLQLDTLSYGRLKQSYTKQGKAEDAEANAHLAVVKDDLDVRRAAVNAECEAAKNAASDAEMGRHFAHSPEEVDRAIAMMSDLERFEAAQTAHMAELKTTVKSYEDRIDAIRKSA